MTSSRPYLIRALYEWVVDNGFTPYILVDATHRDCNVPPQHVQDGRIVLNISPTAVQGLLLGNDWVEFSARFSGRPTGVHLPVRAVLAIYAKENGQGMSFPAEAEEEEATPPPPEPSTPPPVRSGRPHLKVVK